MRNLAQQQVANFVTESVIHRLEAIEIDEQHRHAGLVAPGMAQHAVQAVGKQGAVGRPVRRSKFAWRQMSSSLRRRSVTSVISATRWRTSPLALRSVEITAWPV